MLEEFGTYAEDEMPKYKSEEVWALKIKSIVVHIGGSYLYFEDERYAPLKVTAEYTRMYAPRPGGYYVVYEDGSKSWSRAEAFEKVYTLVEI